MLFVINYSFDVWEVAGFKQSTVTSEALRVYDKISREVQKLVEHVIGFTKDCKTVETFIYNDGLLLPLLVFKNSELEW